MDPSRSLTGGSQARSVPRRSEAKKQMVGGFYPCLRGVAILSPAWRSHSAREDGPPACQKFRVVALVRGILTRNVMSHGFKPRHPLCSALVVCCVIVGHFCPPHSAGPSGISVFSTVNRGDRRAVLNSQ